MKFNHKLLKEIRNKKEELLEITLMTRQTSHLYAKVLRYSGKKQVFFLFYLIRNCMKYIADRTQN